MNKVILMGNVGTDPTLHYYDKRAVAFFKMATNEPARRLPDGGEVPARTEWHNLVATDDLGEFAEKYIRKGTRLFVSGTLRTRNWEDKHGINRRVTEIYITELEILGRL